MPKPEDALEWLKAHSRFSRWLVMWIVALNAVSSTNAKAIGTLALYFLTWASYTAAVLLAKEPDAVNFGMWLAFLAGLGGFSLAQFRQQRETDYGALERKAEIERAKAGAPAKAGVTVNADSATVIPAPTGETK